MPRRTEHLAADATRYKDLIDHAASPPHGPDGRASVQCLLRRLGADQHRLGLYYASGWVDAGVVHTRRCTMDCVSVWPYRHGRSQLIVRQSRATRCLIETLAADGSVPVDLWCSAAALACVCAAYLQSAAGRGRGVRDGGGPYMPPCRF
jgi:hypothetical protein